LDSVRGGIPKCVGHFQRMLNPLQILCPTAVFSFYLNRDLYNNTVGGELTLCGIDPTHYQGPIAWEPLISATYWQIQLGGLSINGQQIINGPVTAIVDSGTSLIAGPPALVQKTISNLPPITFVIGGAQLVMTAQSYVIKVTIS
uniref:Peptidase A1 domain-containing protein n=1 Tax=Haemonchus placei TaxID=6290 RepID=A0A0N4WJ97_HAEPC